MTSVEKVISAAVRRMMLPAVAASALLQARKIARKSTGHRLPVRPVVVFLSLGRPVVNRDRLLFAGGG
jgi:hypothetical protein